MKFANKNGVVYLFLKCKGILCLFFPNNRGFYILYPNNNVYKLGKYFDSAGV